VSVSALAGLSVLSINTRAAEPGTEIIVTATRTAQTADETLAAVNVITRADIERTQAKSAAELLTGLAGVDSSASGGYGKSTGFFLRGTNSNHTLVLVDGVRVGSATLGYAQLEFLPVTEIERIEIVRGPASSLYGADAIGGVIQIFTRRGHRPFAAGAEAGYGTYSTGSGSAGVAGENDSTHYSVHVSRLRTGGFDAQRNSAATPWGPTPSQPDKDSYWNNSASLNAGHRFANGTSIETSLLGSGGVTKYDGFYGETRFQQQAWSARAGINPVSMWHTRLSVGTNLDGSDNYYSDLSFGSRIVSRRQTANWQNDFTLAEKQIITAAIDAMNESVSGTVAYTDMNRENRAGYLQYLGEFGALSSQLSARHDDNSAFGTHDTGQIALGYRIMPMLRLSASYGTAFKAPTLNDLYWPTESYTDTYGITYITIGNPSVQPEESHSSEIALRYQPATHTQLRISGFRTEIRNLIEWVSIQTGVNQYTYMPDNVTRAHIDGVETEFRTVWASWTTQAAYTWVDPRNEATGELLARRAQNTVRLDADRTFGSWRFGLGFLAQSERYDYYGTTPVRLAGYGILNLRAHYDITKAWWLRARLDNVGDKQYETAHTYNSPGRNLFVSVGYQGS
jgi:vitamin B12 transporter